MNHVSVPIDPRDWLEVHGDVLYGLALRGLNNPQEAEDLVQDTLLLGIRNLATFQGRSSLRTWLVAILKNRMVDYLRSQSRRPQSVGEVDVEIACEQSQPGLLVEEEEDRAQLQNCIAELPDQVRQLFLLSEVEGHGHGLLAERFELSRVHLRVRLHRARLKVRDCLVSKGVVL